MAGISAYLANKLLDHSLKGGAAYTQPTNIYLQLFTAAPNDAGGGTPVAGSGFARPIMEFDAASGKATQNTNIETMTAAGGNWGTITHWGLFDALTSGNLLYFGSFATSRVINDGDSFIVKVGDLDVSVA